jgi:hypothetical protein
MPDEHAMHVSNATLPSDRFKLARVEALLETSIRIPHPSSTATDASYDPGMRNSIRGFAG